MDIPVIIDHQPTAEGTRGGKSVSGVDDGRRERERKIEEKKGKEKENEKKRARKRFPYPRFVWINGNTSGAIQKQLSIPEASRK